MAPTSVISTTFNGRLWISFLDYSENKKNKIKLKIINRISIYKVINRSFIGVSLALFSILSNLSCLLLYKYNQNGIYPFHSFASAIVEVEE